MPQGHSIIVNDVAIAIIQSFFRTISYQTSLKVQGVVTGCENKNRFDVFCQEFSIRFKCTSCYSNKPKMKGYLSYGTNFITIIEPYTGLINI